MPEVFTMGRRVPAILGHLGDLPVRRGHVYRFFRSCSVRRCAGFVAARRDRGPALAPHAPGVPWAATWVGR